MAEGQYLGRKATFIYTADNDKKYLLTLDDTLGSLPQCGLVRATSTNAADLADVPKLLRPRYVLWQGICDGRIVRKTLICNRDAPAYASSTSTSFNISDSTEGATTGKVGEKQTFRKIPTAVS